MWRSRHGHPLAAVVWKKRPHQRDLPGLARAGERNNRICSRSGFQGTGETLLASAPWATASTDTGTARAGFDATNVPNAHLVEPVVPAAIRSRAARSRSG